MSSTPSCSVCNKSKGTEAQIQRCSGCHQRLYCGTACQAADWTTHKKLCAKKKTGVWYDKRRKCQDGSLHEGKLELITWPCEKEDKGWGNCCADESDDLRLKFENEYGGDEAKFYKYWPQGFRWTCCGTDAGMAYGCDHHGTGSKPCTCDFCRMGKPLPLRIYNEDNASRHGLQLRRGPDERSYNANIAPIAETARGILGI